MLSGKKGLTKINDTIKKDPELSSVKRYKNKNIVVYVL